MPVRVQQSDFDVGAEIAALRAGNRRIGAIAKGVRKTKSRFGARLEPFSHVELLLHEGSGELHTVTGVSLVDAHRSARSRSPRRRSRSPGSSRTS